MCEEETGELGLTDVVSGGSAISNWVDSGLLNKGALSMSVGAIPPQFASIVEKKSRIMGGGGSIYLGSRVTHFPEQERRLF